MQCHNQRMLIYNVNFKDTRFCVTGRLSHPKACIMVVTVKPNHLLSRPFNNHSRSIQLTSYFLKIFLFLFRINKWRFVSIYRLWQHCRWLSNKVSWDLCYSPGRPHQQLFWLWLQKFFCSRNSGCSFFFPLSPHAALPNTRARWSVKSYL